MGQEWWRLPQAGHMALSVQAAGNEKRSRHMRLGWYLAEVLEGYQALSVWPHDAGRRGHGPSGH